jgi:hypothetical protein
MAILVISTLPEMVTLDQALAVSKEVGASGEPPAGGISHGIIVDGGRVKVIDIWESQEALDTFSQQRLIPAIMKVMAQFGMEGPPPPPDNQVFEAHDAMGAPTAGS